MKRMLSLNDDEQRMSQGTNYVLSTICLVLDFQKILREYGTHYLQRT